MSQNHITTNASAAKTAHRGIKFHKARMVRTWHLFTNEGEPLFSYGGTGTTLEKSTRFGPRSPVSFYEGNTQKFKIFRQKKAEKDIGIPCEWREVEPTEMSAVSF